MNNNIQAELNRLNFEDWLFIITIFLSALNILSDQLQKEYLKTKNKKYLKSSSTIITAGLIISVFIYLYFVKRNYNAFRSTSKENKEIFAVKLLGSVFLVTGILCLIYFQTKSSYFIGSPAI